LRFFRKPAAQKSEDGGFFRFQALNIAAQFQVRPESARPKPKTS
jgi:hypothetical protein